MSSIEKQLVESSRELANIVVANIGNSHELFNEAMGLMYKNIYPISMRAAWVVHLVSQKHPKLVQPHIEKLVHILPKTKVDGVKRSVLKMLIETPYEIPEDSLGELADITFSFAKDPKQAIAVRAFSIDILLRVIKIYPEISSELIVVMESMIPEGSAGLKNKCRKTIAKLKRT